MLEILDLSRLDNGLLKLTTSYLNSYRDAAIHLLVQNNHSVGVVLNLSGDNVKPFELIWLPPTAEEISSFHNTIELKRAAEDAGLAITFLLVDKFLPGYSLKVSRIDGNGFDYSLVREPSGGFLPFGNSIPLEVSGIAKESGTNNLERRCRNKEQRFNDKGVIKISYISVTEFSEPKAKFYLYNGYNKHEK